MARRPGREFAVGSFAALALAVWAIAIMSVGTDSELFVKSVRYRVFFPDTVGLRAGSPVKMSGVQVGSVAAISLPVDPSVDGILVDLRIEEEFAPRVRADTRAGIKFLQLVSGEKYVDVTPGSASAEPLSPGSMLAVDPGTEFFAQGADIANNLNDVTAALKDVLRPLRDGEGLLGELIQDPEFGREGLAALRGTLENLETITSNLRAGRGFIGRVLTDEGLSKEVDELAATLAGLSNIVASIERREGALGAILEDDGPAEVAVRELAAAAATLRRVSDRLERPDGLLGRLLNDTEWSEGLADDVRQTVKNAADITRKINEGEGTLGALVNERVLHDGMEEVVAGVNDSKFARWLTRHYQKKGIQLELESAPPESAE